MTLEVAAKRPLSKGKLVKRLGKFLEDEEITKRLPPQTRTHLLVMQDTLADVKGKKQRRAAAGEE